MNAAGNPVVEPMPLTGTPLDTPESPSGRTDPGGFVHLKPLDGLRGMAIGLVLLYHFLWANTETSSRTLQIFIGIKDSLWIGVDLFFALSGFLITGILFDSLHTRRFLRNFYGRRLVRIVPLYYLALLVLALLTRPLAISWQGLQWYPILYLANSPWYVGHMPGSLTVATHLWSLSLEEQFYLIWPFLVLLLKDRRRLMGFALALSLAALILRLVLVAQGAGANVTYMILPARMDGLLLGGWLALAIRGPARSAVLRLAPIVFALSAALILIVGVAQHGFDHLASPWVNSVGYSLTAAASASLIAITLRPRGLAARAFSASWLRALGRYSYGIYVWHPIVAALLLLRLREFAGNYTDSRLLRLLLSTALAILLSVLAGVLSYHLFEVHFLRLKRFFAYGH